MDIIKSFPYSSLIIPQFSRLFEIINSSATVLNAGFALGFIHSCKRNKQKIISNPLLTLFSATFSGFITAFFTNIIGSFMPKNIRFLIPLTVLLLCYYYGGKNDGNGDNDDNNANNKRDNTYDTEHIYADNI